MAQVKVETSVEGVKRASDYLRGELARELSSAEASVSDDSEQLLKFHGIYAQDNRDVRRERALAKEPLEYIFMIRVVVPGGRLDAEQWLALDEVASDLADGSIRLTTRQAVQFHGVLKGDLRSLARTLDRRLLSSFGGCGDVVRNVVMCPALHTGDEGGSYTLLVEELREAFRSASPAYWEIFVDGERAASREAFEEKPFYGEAYLPRKFKIAVAHPEDNCVDVYAQDVGLIPASHDELGPGFNVLVGGGLGRSYAHEDTFAHLAQPLTFAARGEVHDVIAAVVATYRDLGDRTDRKRARLKYVVADLGLEAFKAEVEERYGRALRSPLALGYRFDADDHLGWREAPDGTWQLGVRVGAGRVRDHEDGQGLRSLLRQLAERYGATYLLTPQQDLVAGGFTPDQRDEVDRLLKVHAVRSSEELGNVERHALACPALPTCSQALTESERRLPELVEGLEDALAARQLARRPLQLRVTGCPNGCARPAIAEVGVVGRTKSTYDLFLGGHSRGDRLAGLFKEKVRLEDIPDLLGPLFDRWGEEGELEESFGDFVVRAGIV